jgi:DNA polymerase III delta prime subunit
VIPSSSRHEQGDSFVNQIQQALQEALSKGLTDNLEIATYIRKAVPGASTTPASVSSMKSRLKSAIALGEALPSGSSALAQSLAFQSLPAGDDTEETIEEASKRISLRYKAMERMCKRIVAGGMPSLIVSGPPGLGKSYTALAAIEEKEAEGTMANVLNAGLLDADPEGNEEAEGSLEEKHIKLFDIISGSITAVGLYQALWNTRKGGVLVLDDIDEVFRDEVCLNLLKAALDSGKKRMLSWRKEASWLDEYGIEKTFEFKGHVVFLTNIDFEMEIAKNGKLAEHFKALIDRSMYLCLTLRTKRDFMIRIRQVAGGKDGMLCSTHGLSLEEADEVLDFITDHQDRFYNLSLRLADQVARMRAIDPDGWMEDVEATKMRSN